jgi:hypothetical protein
VTREYVLSSPRRPGASCHRCSGPRCPWRPRYRRETLRQYLVQYNYQGPPVYRNTWQTLVMVSKNVQPKEGFFAFWEGGRVAQGKNKNQYLLWFSEWCFNYLNGMKLKINTSRKFPTMLGLWVWDFRIYKIKKAKISFWATCVMSGEPGSYCGMLRRLGSCWVILDYNGSTWDRLGHVWSTLVN